MTQYSDRGRPSRIDYHWGTRGERMSRTVLLGRFGLAVAMACTLIACGGDDSDGAGTGGKPITGGSGGGGGSSGNGGSATGGSSTGGSSTGGSSGGGGTTSS